MRRQLFRSFRSSCVLGVVAAVVVSLTVGPVAVAAAGATPIRSAVVAAAPSAAGAVVSVTPARIADSRINQQINGPVAALGTATVQVTGQGGIPAANVAAAVLNVTVVSPQSAGYITVWPSGIDKTNTSNLNFQAGQNIPNTVIVPVGADGKIQLFNGSWGTTHLLVDVTGYTLAGTASGTVWAWGDGTWGQLGNGGAIGSSVPVQVSELTEVISIAGSAVSGYALRSDGTVWAWGSCVNGDATDWSCGYCAAEWLIKGDADSSVPVQVPGIIGVTAIASSRGTAYALRGDGTVWA